MRFKNLIHLLNSDIQVANLSKLPVPSVEQAGLLLDAALAARDPALPNHAANYGAPQGRAAVQQQRSANHFMFTIHLHHMGTTSERERCKTLCVIKVRIIELRAVCDFSQ